MNIPKRHFSSKITEYLQHEKHCTKARNSASFPQAQWETTSARCVFWKCESKYVHRSSSVARRVQENGSEGSNPGHHRSLKASVCRGWLGGRHYSLGILCPLSTKIMFWGQRDGSAVNVSCQIEFNPLGSHCGKRGSSDMLSADCHAAVAHEQTKTYM